MSKSLIYKSTRPNRYNLLGSSIPFENCNFLYRVSIKRGNNGLRMYNSFGINENRLVYKSLSNYNSRINKNSLRNLSINRYNLKEYVREHRYGNKT